MKSVVPTVALFGESAQLGERIELGSYTLSADEIVAFARQWDPQFFHMDADRAASEGYFGGLIASGVQTLAVYQRLVVDALVQYWDVIGGAGIRDLQFRRPVRPADTLTGFAVIEDVEYQPDRGRARVVYGGELINQNRELALIMTMSAYLRLRVA
ncbi:cyanate lyase protein [Salinisphaera shabanensis E1L3A]|jgi:acyl dehydratase|uniref:Cyanate lyase protein n=1 Tax=Salinisphaera shabanensis E1L3A TaxID=1033802 RepID=F7Q4D7_9GAMM|nr:MaoC/PaaZ C-terminal domain-containing protein [Salinisphaera shabanensis]ERJ17456.1 cyanate lyase protein [Salinisphaera shabanensis E1L3A]